MENEITVIVPVYKIEESYLRQCIESIIDQSRTDYHVILVDDGSPDNCGAICDEYAEKSPVITVIHQGNQGVSAARNAAINQLHTKWLTFLDADDWVEKDYVETIYNCLNDKAQDADIITFDYIEEFRSSSVTKSLEKPEGFLDENVADAYKRAVFFRPDSDIFPKRYEAAVLWNKVYKTDLLKKNELLFNPTAKKGQDRLFNSEAVTLANKIFYESKVLYHYRCFEASRTNRYDPAVPGLVTLELKEIQNVIKKHDLESKIRSTFDAYVSTRLYSCMRLCYFHSSNLSPYKERVKGLKDLVGSEPYRSALKNVNMGMLSLEEKVFVYCIKLKLYWICSLLVRARSGRTKKKLG